MSLRLVLAGITGTALLLTSPAAAGNTVDQPSATPPVTTAPADPPTTVAKRKAIKVRWDGTMPATMVDRTHIDPQSNEPVPGRDGIPDQPLKPVPGYDAAGNARYGPIPTDGRFAVKLDASRSQGKGRLRCTWVIEADRTVRLSDRPCNPPQTVRLPEGKHQLKLTVRDRNGKRTATGPIRVKNVLMNIMGDSYASGEGLPPFRSTVGGKLVIDWDEPACQRSRWSGFVRTALALERRDPRSNVTLIDVACAGAQIEETQTVGISASGGLLSPQEKATANSDPLDYMPPQVDQLRAIAGKRPWDVTLLSIGGNDVGLAPIVKTCLFGDVLQEKGNCYMEPVVGSQSVPLYQLVDTSLARLEERFQELAPCVGAKGGEQQCKTFKIVNNAPATTATPSRPVVIRNLKKMLQAMYPDLTNWSVGGTIEPCVLTTPPLSPLNPIDNTWAYGALYTGEPGKPVALPTTYPQYRTPDPNPVVPTQPGLLPMLRENRATYGWRLGLTMFRQSHPFGVCSPQRWEYGITDIETAPVSNTSAALHPNDTGQAEYAQMLTPVSVRMAGIPVKRN